MQTNVDTIHSCKPQQYSFKNGIKDGMPIALGYLSVSFSFGILASSLGIPAFFSVLISMTNLTSAGQFAGIGLMVASASFVEMVLTQFVINIRYSLMSVSLSQKIDPSTTFLSKLAIAFFVTDEIFVVASNKENEISKKYMYGLGVLPLFAWSFGTFLGAISGDFLPATLCVSLGIALHAMFIAIVVPVAKKCKPVAIISVISVVISCVLNFTPVTCNISNGFVIIICAVLSSAIGALLFPISEKEESL
ncbi:MAG: AzlC family ABC transporter permease [Acutalibacteraceae bacterium]|jgi:4-azaleucine resistance transporter AzlC|nr:AzlC family ABC transporter permease [Clostridiales bacterium]